MVKNRHANAEEIRDAGSIPGLGRYTGGGHGNPLQSSCLENPMDKRAWRATVHGVVKSQTKQSDLAHIGHKKFNEIKSREVRIKGPGIRGFSQTHKFYTVSKAFFQRHSF